MHFINIAYKIYFVGSMNYFAWIQVLLLAEAVQLSNQIKFCTLNYATAYNVYDCYVVRVFSLQYYTGQCKIKQPIFVKAAGNKYRVQVVIKYE